MICACTSRRRDRAGVAVVYVVVAIAVMLAFASFAVEFGQVQVVKTELQRAADAAARAAAYRMMAPAEAITLAKSTAAANSALAAPIILSDADVEFLKWDPDARTFTVLSGTSRSGANAIRVTARRTVPLSLAQVADVSSIDVKAQSVIFAANRFVGFVGLDSARFTGTGSSKMDSWDSGAGPYSSLVAQDKAAVASNGDINLGGKITLRGEAHPGPGRNVIISGGASITGDTTPLKLPLSFPAANAGAYATDNDNGLIPTAYYNTSSKAFILNATTSLPGGIYYFSSFTIGTKGSLTFTGPATIYVNGHIDMQGAIFPKDMHPMNLKIRVTAPATSVTIKATAAFSADVYCPLSDLNVSGSADYYGGYIGKTLTFAGSADLHYDEALGTTGAYGGLSLVQ